MKAAWSLMVLVACTTPSASEQREVQALRASMDKHDADLTEAERAVASLSSRWARVTEAYRRAESAYAAAQTRYEASRAASDRAAAGFEQASEDFAAARKYWIWYQKLVVFAAGMAIRGMQAQSAADYFSCESVSTSAFREMLIAAGHNLVGKDIDHIVPRSLGGADHPSNYQVLDSSENRSLGNTWDVGKCVDAGDRCAEAVAVSEECGDYTGGLP